MKLHNKPIYGYSVKKIVNENVVMNYVITKEVFSINGMPVVKALKAEIVSTEKTILDLA
ncbi:MAG: hypothetical protein ACRC28_09800 [Clostridium sp.]|uniref:hypothetical protein n=1 Tax=Clostridium sp. TaxID=1506 RepID=UPI003F2CA3C1